MSQFDLKITNGTVANSAETFQADIGVKDGKIITIGKKLGNADRVIDASGKYVLPGGIEAHCHIEQESSSGIMTSDDYYSGSVSAAFGGNTCFVPFAVPTDSVVILESCAGRCHNAHSVNFAVPV